MPKGQKPKHINMASLMMSVFMRATWDRVAAAARLLPQGQAHEGYDNSHGRRLPKGFRGHAPAGTKLARLARNSAIGLRGRVALTD